MRTRAKDHGVIGTMRGGPHLLALALAAVVVAAPLSSAWHELTVQHVRCAEHGEITHVAATSSSSSVGVVRDFVTVEAQEPGTGTIDGHDHCALGLVVRNSAASPVARTTVRYVPPPAVTRTTPARPSSLGRAVVLASAPKTSPPSV